MVVYGITNYPQRTGLTQPPFVLSHFLWLRKLGWFWLWVSHESQSACCQGCSHLKAWRGLEGPLPSWRSQRGFWLEATVPDHMDLSTGLLKYPHNQSKWEIARRKPWCLLSLVLKVTWPCFCSLQMHHIIQALFQGWGMSPFWKKKVSIYGHFKGTRFLDMMYASFWLYKSFKWPEFYYFMEETVFPLKRRW